MRPSASMVVMRATWLRLLFGLTLLGAAPFAAAQSYRWIDVVQDVSIEANGDVIVEDTRTLWTSDDFGEAFICFELEAGQSITLLDGSGAVSPGPPATAFQQPCDAGTELVVRNQTRVKERRVRFVYRLRGTVEFYSDVVQWYFNLEQLDHPPIDGYRLTVRAPGPMAFPYDAYVHRYFNTELPLVTLSEDRSELAVVFRQIPDGSGVEIRYLMDPALFGVRGTEAAFERLLLDEERVARLDERRSAVARFRRTPILALIPAALVVWFAAGLRRVYGRIGREPRIPTMKYPFEPPSDVPPAAVTAMQMQRFSESSMHPAFSATVMDLARRGFVELMPRGRKVDLKLDLTRSEGGLLPFEASVLSYLKSAAKSNQAEPGLLKFEALKAYSLTRMGSYLPRWAKSVRTWVEARAGGPLVTKESSQAANSWAGRGVLLLLACGLGFLAVSGVVKVAFALGGVLAVVLIIVAASSLPAWKQEVAQEVYGWQGFKRTLSDYTIMKDAPLDFFKLWDVYYAYAAALGVAERYLKTIRRAAPQAGVDESTMVARAHWMGSGSSLSSLSSLSSSVSSLSSALASASASASSGGSSSGGGGGGGGGGSGGR